MWWISEKASEKGQPSFSSKCSPKLQNWLVSGPVPVSVALGGRKLVVWRLPPDSKDAMLFELAVAKRVSIFGSRSAVPDVMCFLKHGGQPI